MLALAADHLRLEWELHDVQLDQAVQNLQLKAGTTVDVGSVARFLGSILQWFNAGRPTISGVVQTATDKAVSIHLAATGGRIKCVAVTASTEAAPGIDPLQLSAERAAFKFLFRMCCPEMTTDEIDGFAAMRQGVAQFAQYALTPSGAGERANTRRSTLAKSAFNLNFFRSIPRNREQTFSTKQTGQKNTETASGAGETANSRTWASKKRASKLNFFRRSAPRDGDQSCSTKQTGLKINDEDLQAALLAEGVAHALVGTGVELRSAIDCFRQLQDWPVPAKNQLLQQQAAYNEAVVWRQIGCTGLSIQMLTELLGERARDTAAPDGSRVMESDPKPELPEAIRFPARLARLYASAQYDRDYWTGPLRSRTKPIIDDAELLCGDLQGPKIKARDRRLANYMYIETLRAVGRVELLGVITGAAAPLYRNGRPVGLKDGALGDEGVAALQRAISWMLTCEPLSPSSELYADLAEAYLLLKDFKASAGYARHAILESNAPSERAYYLAAESLYLQNTDESRALAIQCAGEFPDAVELPEFQSLRAELDALEQPAKAEPPGATALSAHG